MMDYKINGGLLVTGSNLTIYNKFLKKGVMLKHIRIDGVVHQKAKIQSAKEGLSLKEYTEKALIKNMSQKSKSGTTEAANG